MCAALPQSLGAGVSVWDRWIVAVPEARLELEAAALAADPRAVHRGEEVDEELHRQRAGADSGEKPLLRREAASQHRNARPEHCTKANCRTKVVPTTAKKTGLDRKPPRMLFSPAIDGARASVTC